MEALALACVLLALPALDEQRQTLAWLPPHGICLEQYAQSRLWARRLTGYAGVAATEPWQERLAQADRLTDFWQNAVIATNRDNDRLARLEAALYCRDLLGLPRWVRQEWPTAPLWCLPQPLAPLPASDGS